MKTVSHRLRDQYGYSMVEVLAAIVILSLAIIPMLGMFDAGLRAASTSSNYDKARALANANLEAAKAEPSVVDESGDCPVTEDPLYTCSLKDETVYIDAEGSDSAPFESEAGDDALEMTKVTVTVTWDGKNYVTSGIVAE